MIDFIKKKMDLPDGVCNPVRNVSALKRCGRGCKPRPAQKTLRTGLQTPSGTKKRCGRGCKPRPAQTPSGTFFIL
jgi:hypothetical protein